MPSIRIRRTRRSVNADVRVPGDKSISHRALMCASIARGVSQISGANVGADVSSTLDALRAVGVQVVTDSNGTISVQGVDEFRDPREVIDCGNSGSTLRMLAGLFAGRVNARLDGDESLRRRPIERVAEPLRQMGASVATGADGRPPVVLRRSREPLRGRRIELPVASAQVKSAVAFAALRADGPTVIVQPLATRDHTERMLRSMGADVRIDGLTVVVNPSALAPLSGLRVPGDFSSAFYFIAAAAACPSARVRIRAVGVNPSRVAALEIVREMGASVTLTNEHDEFGEPVADVDVRGGLALQNVSVPAEVVPNLIDEIPALCALAALSRGEFTVRSAAELRTKESDRIATTVALLRAFGADVDELPDGLVVRGGRRLQPPARVDTHGDHRIGMSAALLAVGQDGEVVVDDAACIATSFPGFEQQWEAAFG